ncbi:branched-chain amino acid ABC transporter ATP-binding protein, partial [Rhodovulum sulfidophilum]|nr:branched-chain amino acid ABC transporter ATP-binding protein [Rhodovulum sulfidophilum]
APIIVSQVFEVVQQIAAKGTTVLIVEQNVYSTLKVAQRGYVLENGRIVLSESAEDLLQDDYVRQAYLGI